MKVFVLTRKAECLCPHGSGRLTFSEKPARVTSGSALLHIDDIRSAKIQGCLNPPASGGRCTSIVFAEDPAGAALTIEGIPVATELLVAATQLGTISVRSTGESKVTVEAKQSIAAYSQSIRKAPASRIGDQSLVLDVFWHNSKGDRIWTIAPGAKAYVSIRMSTKLPPGALRLEIYETFFHSDGNVSELPIFNIVQSDFTEESIEVEIPLPPLKEAETCKRAYFARVTINEKPALDSNPVIRRHFPDGYHYALILGVSWVPFAPLANTIVEIARASLRTPADPQSSNIPLIDLSSSALTFRSLIRRIISYSSLVDPSLEAYLKLDAQKAMAFFRDVLTSASVETAVKQKILALLPLALSANFAPGHRELARWNIDAESVEILMRRLRPHGTINARTLCDDGLGDYRGYFHFVPWIRICDGEIVQSGIMASDEFRPNVTKAGSLTDNVANFSLAKPISSSSITPVPFDLTGFFADWDDVIGGLFMLLKNFDLTTSKAGSSLSDFIYAAGEPLLNKLVWWPTAKELRFGFGKWSLDGGRRVLFERAQPFENWVPSSSAILDSDGHIRLAIADFRHGGRVAPEGREIGQKLFGKDVPWICLGARTQFKKESATLQIGHSLFPSHAIFMGATEGDRSGSLLRHASTYTQMLEDVSGLERVTVIAAHPATAKDAFKFIDQERGAEPMRAAALFPDSPLFRSTAIRSQGTQSASGVASAASAFGDMSVISIDLLNPLREGWQFDRTQVFWSENAEDMVRYRYLAVLIARSNQSNCGTVGWFGHAALLTGRWSGKRELLSCLDDIAVSGVYLDEDLLSEGRFCASFLADRGLGTEPLDRQPELAACIPIDDAQLSRLAKLISDWGRYETASPAHFLRDAAAVIGFQGAIARTRHEMSTETLHRLIEMNAERFRSSAPSRDE